MSADERTARARTTTAQAMLLALAGTRSTQAAAASGSTKPTPRKAKAAARSAKAKPRKAKAKPRKAKAATRSAKAKPRKAKTAPRSSKAAPRKTKTAPRRTKATPRSTKAVAPSVPSPEEESGAPARSAARAGSAPAAPPSLLTRPLGLEGWSALEPVLLASLAATEPLLLIGRHGAAKSFLLERLAEALGLEFRCYNASLIDYDDLVGIPVPDEDGKGLHYIATPTAIWGAEVVFVDEISRTRPDLANKLFPIIHERRVQGVPLERLRHRWAAMNPPAPEDADLGDANDELYLGVEPLDPALADRFTYLIEVPDWAELTDSERARLLVDQFRGKHPFPVDLPALVDDARRTYELLVEDLPERLSAYFVALGKVRSGANARPLSTRRMATLMRSSLALQAARVALARGADPAARLLDVDWEGSVWLAVQHGDPALASAGALDRAKQLALHRQAWTLCGLAEDDPWRALLEVSDPLERVARALRLGGGVEPDDLGQLVLDALASEETEALRVATALALYLGSRRVHGLPAVVVETLARDARRVLQPVTRELQVRSSSMGPPCAVGRIAAELRQDDERPAAVRDRYALNLLESLLPDGYAGTTPDEVHARFTELWARFGLEGADPSEGPS